MADMSQPISTTASRASALATLARRLSNWSMNVLMIAISIVMFMPFYWAITTAIVDPLEAFQLPPDWFPTDLSLTSFRRVFDEIPFWQMFFNSIKVSLIITVGSVITSTFAGYAFARLTFPGKDILFVIFLAALMVPGQVTIIPTFIIIRNLGLMDTHEAIYIPGLINVFGIFLLRQFFMRTPRDLEDAARVDGAGYLRVIFQIAVPLAAPAISALAILNFQAAWNDFFAPNLFLRSPEMFTLPVGLVNLHGQFGGTPTTIFAAITLVIIPVLVVYLLAQRRLTESIALTGMRG